MSSSDDKFSFGPREALWVTAAALACDGGFGLVKPAKSQDLWLKKDTERSNTITRYAGLMEVGVALNSLAASSVDDGEGMAAKRTLQANGALLAATTALSLYSLHKGDLDKKKKIVVPAVVAGAGLAGLNLFLSSKCSK